MDTKIVLLNVSDYHISPTGDCSVGSNSAASVIFRTTFSEDWDGMAITAKFTDAADESVTDILLTEQNEDGSWDIKMPHESAKYDGEAKLSFAGALLDGETVVKRNTTKPLAIRVIASYTERYGDNTEPITPTDAEQLHNAAIVATDRSLQASRHAAEANEAKKDAVSAKEAAEIAKTDAVSAKEAAEAAKTSAESSFNAAAAAAGDARESKVAAEAHKVQAQSARDTAARAAQSANVNADAAEEAKNEAVTAMGAAISAKGAAEAAQSYAEEAKRLASGYSTDANLAATNAAASEESAASSAAKAEQAIANIHDIYPTETQNGVTEAYTDIGADNVPVKSLAVTVSSGSMPVTFSVKRMGKNLLDKANLKLIYGKTIDTTTGEPKTSGSYCVADGFIQVKPGTKYALSGVVEGKNGYVVNVHFYAANKSYLKLRANATDSTVVFTTPDNCHFIRFTVPQYAHSMYGKGAKEGDVGAIKSTLNPQLELGAETPYEAYTETRHSVTVSALNTPTELSDVTTKLGVNAFELERLDGISASMSVTYRLDPTLAYEKLKAAIIAAGAT